MKHIAIAIIITIAALLLLGWAALDTHAQTPRYSAQCVMLTGCFYHPLHPATGNPYPESFWMWVPIWITLQPHQYDRVWRSSDWRWIEEVTL